MAPTGCTRSRSIVTARSYISTPAGFGCSPAVATTGPSSSAIARAAEALSARELIIDGEATVVGKTGLPDFQGLRRELAKKHTDRLIYMAFDLLYVVGHDLRGLPLIERKRALHNVVAKALPDVRGGSGATSNHTDAHGQSHLG